MWCWFVMMAVMGHLVAASNDDFLLDNCRVEGIQTSLKFTTFEVAVGLHLARSETNAIPIIVIKQKNNQKRFSLGNFTKPWKWVDVELELGVEPKVLLNGEEVAELPDKNGFSGFKNEMMWNVEIKNALAYIRCDRRWPVFVLNSDKSAEIPRSGRNEKIKLLPTKAMIIRLTVGEQEMMICQEEDKVVVKNYDPNQTCPTLDPYTFTEEIDITVDDEGKSIKIQKEGLSGLLYIVQCVDDCIHPDPSYSPGYYGMMAFMIIFIITTVALAVALYLKDP